MIEQTILIMYPDLKSESTHIARIQEKNEQYVKIKQGENEIKIDKGGWEVLKQTLDKTFGRMTKRPISRKGGISRHSK